MIRALRLPLPPSTNHLYPNLTNGQRVKSREAKAYTALMGWEIRAQWGPQAWQGQRGWEPYTGDVALGWAIFPKRRRDVDNMFKIVQDGLTVAGVYRDDAQVGGYAVLRHPPVWARVAHLWLFVGPLVSLHTDLWPLVLGTGETARTRQA